MINYILYKLKEGFVVTSDEEPFNTDLCLYSNQEILPFDGNLGEIWNYELCKKVIAQQDQIDLFSLSEEEQKEIGWFDVEKLYKQYFPKLNQSKEREIGEKTGFEIGFKLAQELLSDRRFTEKDLRNSYGQGVNDGSANIWNEEKCIRSLSQPKLWKVDIIQDCNKVTITKIYDIWKNTKTH